MLEHNPGHVTTGRSSATGYNYIKMEGVAANISGTCPLAFSGSSGVLFAQAVAAVVAAHCTIVDDHWPKDRANEILKTSAPTYDFIIAGAGTAGSLLASRLAKSFPDWSILLVEAGDNPGLDSEVPSFLFLNQNTTYDWHYKTVPDRQSCLGYRNNSCIWSKGKGMGGSGSINAMLYIRGHPHDYDNWEKSGNTDWGYAGLKPYFDKLEKEFGLDNKNNPQNPWYNFLTEAWHQLGYDLHAKENNEAQIGTRVNKILTRNGVRLNPAKIYLQDLENIHVVKSTIVNRVVIDSVTKTAIGVEIKHNSGQVIEIIARKEVILAAGTVATPNILFASGIGHKSVLKNNSIDSLIELPVGQNLQDHVLVPLFFKTNFNIEISSQMIILSLLQYMLTRTGPISTIGVTDYMSFINTENSTDHPNIQYHHTYFIKNEEFLLAHYLSGIGLKNEIIDKILKLNKESALLGIYPTLLHPKSKGNISIKDNETVIHSNYFDHPDDIKTLIKSIDFLYKLEQTEVFKKHEIKHAKLEIDDCINFDEPDYWDCYIRHMATTIYHPVGTAKMGMKSDETSVVSPELKVHNVENLRVVDASVMPTIPGGNTMAATLVIAEKAADIIKKKYDVKDEL